MPDMNQLNIRENPMLFLIIGGIYDSLISNIKIMSQENFLQVSLNEALTVLNEPENICFCVYLPAPAPLE